MFLDTSCTERKHCSTHITKQQSGVVAQVIKLLSIAVVNEPVSPRFDPNQLHYFPGAQLSMRKVHLCQGVFFCRNTQRLCAQLDCDHDPRIFAGNSLVLSRMNHRCADGGSFTSNGRGPARTKQHNVGTRRKNKFAECDSKWKCFIKRKCEWRASATAMHLVAERAMGNSTRSCKPTRSKQWWARVRHCFQNTRRLSDKSTNDKSRPVERTDRALWRHTRAEADIAPHVSSRRREKNERRATYGTRIRTGRTTNNILVTPVTLFAELCSQVRRSKRC